MTQPISPHTIPDEEVFYPEEDGEPMAETDFQRKPLIYGVEALSIYFQDRPDVYVSGNMFVYYAPGNPRAVVAPDVFVVFGVAKYDRRIYKIWEEGKAPDVVFEITSKKTRKEDTIDKVTTYRELGVREYFQYDPTGDYLNPVVQGRRLDGQGQYQRIAPRWLPGGVLCLESQVLGLEVHLEDGRMRLYDAQGGFYLLTHAEEFAARQAAEQARKAEEQARKAEEQARRAAEARITALEAELARLRGEHGA
jgi:Uma2 family endonuclease